MRHITATEVKKARQVQRFVEDGPGIGIAAEPPESREEARIGRYESYLVALASKPSDQGPGLDRLAPRDLHTGSDHRNPRTHQPQTSASRRAWRAFHAARPLSGPPSESRGG